MGAPGSGYRERVAFLAIANLEGYDYWPVHDFARNAVHDEARRAGIEIYCDWKGELRRRLTLRPDLSTVILLNREGRVLFAHQGPVPPEEQDRLLALLKAELSV